MSNRVLLPAAMRAIREIKAKNDPAFRGSVFATKCLMSHSHLCNIEAGRKRVSVELIHRIAAHLEVPIDAISYVEAPMAVSA